VKYDDEASNLHRAKGDAEARLALQKALKRTHDIVARTRVSRRAPGQLPSCRLKLLTLQSHSATHNSLLWQEDKQVISLFNRVKKRRTT
jgi:hypothetical protein